MWTLESLTKLATRMCGGVQPRRVVARVRAPLAEVLAAAGPVVRSGSV